MRKKLMVGKVAVGGGAPVSIQSMCNTKTDDVAATVAQIKQLEAAGCPQRKELPFHKMLLDGTLPLTMGGGIGQSRLCMLLLGKVHVGEVQVILWDDATVQACKAAGVELL